MPVTKFPYRFEQASSARCRNIVIPVAPPPTMLMIIVQFLDCGIRPDTRRGSAWQPLLKSAGNIKIGVKTEALIRFSRTGSGSGGAHGIEEVLDLGLEIAALFRQQSRRCQHLRRG